MNYYQLYELQHAAFSPLRAAADFTRLGLASPLNPFANTPLARSVKAGLELFERATRRYAKPAFGIETVLIGGARIAVRESVVWERPFCRLIHFERSSRRASSPSRSC